MTSQPTDPEKQGTRGHENPEGEPSTWESDRPSELPSDRPIPENSEVTQESPGAEDMSEPAPGPQTEDSREFLESEPAFADSDAAEDHGSEPGLDPLVATDPTGAPRNPQLGVDEQSPSAD